MAKLSIQFHATIDELVSIIVEWMNVYGVHATGFANPFAVVSLAEPEVHSLLTGQGIARVAFTEGAPDLGHITTGNQFLDRCPGALVLNIGRLSSRGLEQSMLGTMDARPIWKRMAADLRSRTDAGVVGVHETSGATGVYKAFRYTKGAMDLYKSGVPWRAFAQSPVLLRPEGLS